jgi:hypothetical protein
MVILNEKLNLLSIPLKTLVTGIISPVISKYLLFKTDLTIFCTVKEGRVLLIL